MSLGGNPIAPGLIFERDRARGSHTTEAFSEKARKNAALETRWRAYVKKGREEEELGLSQGNIINALGYKSRNAVSNIEVGIEGLPAKRRFGLGLRLTCLDVGTANTIAVEIASAVRARLAYFDACDRPTRYRIAHRVLGAFTGRTRRAAGGRAVTTWDGRAAH